MRALAYFLTDADALRGHPAGWATLKGVFDQYCASHRHVNHGVFADSTDGDTPEFQRMLKHIKASRQAYLVVVPSVEHLGASLRLQVAHVLELDALSCQVRCNNPQAPEPLRAALQHMGVQGEGQEHRRAVREGMKAKASQGLALGKPPYGYRIGAQATLEPVPAEAKTVRHIFGLYLSDGIGVRLIARRLNESGLTTRQGRAWTMVAVRDILRNSAYIGTYRRFGYRVLGSHQGLVSADEFRRVQDRMRSLSPRQRQARSRPFLLTGLLYCGECGSRMMGVTRHRTWRRRDGERVHGEYRYYQCQSRVNRSQCQYHTHHAAAVDEQVLRAVRQSGSGRPGPQQAARGVGQDLRETESMLRALERRYAVWVRRAADGLITLRQLRPAFQRLDMDHQALQEHLAASSGDPERRQEWAGSQLRRIESDWEGLDALQRQQLLRSFVSRVTVRDGKVQIAHR